MTAFAPELMQQIRDRFAHVDSCPFTGERIFFENAGGALTLKSVVDKSAEMAAIPDNQGRDNPASKALVEMIAKCREDAKCFLNVNQGQIIVGESGTELLFRMIRTAALGCKSGGNMVGSTLEHPASKSAAVRWAEIAGKEYRSIAHDNDTGSLDATAYNSAVDENTRVATIIHTSPVTGMTVDIAAAAANIRQRSPDCLIIVDGIQHAAHGGLDLGGIGIDGYAISPYKVFSRHGYGIGWISDRLTALPHDCLIDGPADQWEMGTRDTGAFVTFSQVVDYFEWLGGRVGSQSATRREKLEAAANAIHDHEATLCQAMIKGTGNHRGLEAMEKVKLIGGADNPLREGLVALTVDGLDSGVLVSELAKRGIRVHIRKADHYSGNILTPLDLTSCVRVSMCHYNTLEEVGLFLQAMEELSQ